MARDVDGPRGLRHAGRAFLVEDPDQRGLFRGSWQVAEEQRERERLEPTDEESALAWARKRADVVVIRVLESHPYSAGTVNPWGGPEWPGLQAARANAFIGPTPNDP